MSVDPQLVGLHAKACNGAVLETLPPWWSAGAQCVRDGQLIGEGHAVLQAELARTFVPGVVGRVIPTRRGPAVVMYRGERREPLGAFTLEGDARVTAFHIERSPERIRDLLG